MLIFFFTSIYFISTPCNPYFSSLPGDSCSASPSRAPAGSTSSHRAGWGDVPLRSPQPSSRQGDAHFPPSFSPPWQAEEAVPSRWDAAGAGHCHSGECRSITLHYRAVCCWQEMTPRAEPGSGAAEFVSGGQSCLRADTEALHPRGAR